MKQGDVCWYSFKAPDKRRPVLILTRDSAIPVLNTVTIAPITSTIRSIPTEVVLTEQDGMPATCAANFDNLQTVPKRNLGAHDDEGIVGAGDEFDVYLVIGQRTLVQRVHDLCAVKMAQLMDESGNKMETATPKSDQAA